MVWVVACGGRSMARDLYVSPEGTSQGTGSKEAPLDVFTALSKDSPAKPGDTIYLMGGTYEGKMKGIQRIPFELGVSGTATDPIRVRPVPGQSAHLNGAVVVRSSHAHYLGLDIGDLKWDPWQKKHRASTALNALSGVGAKIINCNIFGGAMGTGCWQPAINFEISGCLIHDFGYLESAGRGHGHAYYTQNKVGTKVFKHNIAYRGCGWNVHVYTQGSNIENYDIVENICYVAGAYKPGQTMDNYLIAGSPPADGIRLIGNVGYQPCDMQAWRPNARLSHYGNVVNGTGVVRNNYLMGAFYGLSLGNWQYLEVTGNTIWATAIHLEISSSPTGVALGRKQTRADLSGYLVDRNTYFANGKKKPFKYGRNEKLVEEDQVAFEDWQALGLDRNSKLLPGKGGKPTGTRVFVFPNEHVKGRGHVGVFNWDGLDRVSVDVSAVLSEGQKYWVYNCLDIRQTMAMAQPILKGIYERGTLSLPMKKSPLSPDFDAFLIIPVE